MKNLLEKLKSIKSQTLISRLIIVIIFLGFSSYIILAHNYFQEKIITVNQFTYKIDKSILSNKDSLTLDLNNKLELLKSDIEKVEIGNDKRFEVLGWSFSILCSFIGVILLINIINSKTSTKDQIRDEVDILDKERKKQIDTQITELKKIVAEYQQEIDNLKNK